MGYDLLVRAETSSDKQRTFTELARRAQIVEAAIEVIAEVGYANASFARIARRAGLSSTGVISYHFEGKDDLLREVALEGLRVAESFVRSRVEGESGPDARLRAYIEANLALVRVHPRHFRALEQVLAARDEKGGRVVDVGPVRRAQMAVEESLRRGQAAGAMRSDFDPHVMALTIRAALGEAHSELRSDPDLDLDAYARELVTTFELATRRRP
jgi:AcrR family transcriptional regulator